MLYIDQVLKSKDVHGCDVITRVYYTDIFALKASKSCSKHEMINFMNSHPYTTVKTKYVRNGIWKEGAVVRVVDDEFLRTDGNSIKADNLGELD